MSTWNALSIVCPDPVQNGVISSADSNSMLQNLDIEHVLDRVFATRRLFEPAWRSPIALPQHVPRDLWFVGDLHGDLTALVNIWNYVSTQSLRRSCQPSVMFLGDIVDRGPQSEECLQFIFWLIAENPGRIGLLPGNHESTLEWDEDRRQLISQVQPAEYAEHLNAAAGEKTRRYRLSVRTAKTAVELFRAAPAAVILPDGLLIAHGGFPHSDLQPGIRTLDDLSRPKCVSDFIWLRCHPRAPRKIPNRHSLGCEFGSDDFAGFGRLMRSLGQPVEHFVRGHDHHPERFHVVSIDGQPRILTLNSMACQMPDESGNTCPARPCIGRHRPGLLPELHQVPMPDPCATEAPDHPLPSGFMNRGITFGAYDHDNR